MLDTIQAAARDLYLEDLFSLELKWQKRNGEINK